MRELESKQMCWRLLDWKVSLLEGLVLSSDVILSKLKKCRLRLDDLSQIQIPPSKMMMLDPRLRPGSSVRPRYRREVRLSRAVTLRLLN